MVARQLPMAMNDPVIVMVVVVNVNVVVVIVDFDSTKMSPPTMQLPHWSRLL